MFLLTVFHSCRSKAMITFLHPAAFAVLRLKFSGDILGVEVTMRECDECREWASFSVHILPFHFDPHPCGNTC